MSLFITGFVGGLAIAAPVGPIGMLCIRRSVADGRKVGFICGLGAATADACYGAIAAFGLSAVTRTLLAERMWLQLFGGLALIWLGIATFRAQPATLENGESSPPKNLRNAYVSTLVLTLMNPMTILSFLVIFAGIGLDQATGAASASLLVLGVFLGSILWWAVVSLAGDWLGSQLEHGGLRIVNFVAGTVIAGLGGWQVFEGARHFVH